MQWIEKKFNISISVNVNCTAPLPLPFKNKEVSTIKTLFVGLALSYCVPEILILLWPKKRIPCKSDEIWSFCGKMNWIKELKKN